MNIQHIRSPMRLFWMFLFLSGAVFTYTNCSSKSGSSAKPTQTQASPIQIEFDPTSSQGVISPLIWGANLNWNQHAQLAIQNGDILRDRSFRTQQFSDPAKRLWYLSPSAPSGGQVVIQTSGGAPTPAGGNPTAGYAELSQNASGFTCIDQNLLVKIVSGRSYTVYFSSYSSGAPAALVAFLTDGLSNPISPIDNYLTASTGVWTEHNQIIFPTAAAKPARFRLCLVSAGTVRVDEIRLIETGPGPSLKTQAKTQIQNLKIKSLRWPGGTSIDTFDWKSSVGPLISRPEIEDDLQYFETPALGLHEFLNLCEELGIEPYVQVNVLKSATHAADLIEYILGSSGTPQGALRSSNGRNSPWNVKYFAIGNEPIETYKGTGSADNTGANYATLAKSIATAMKSKAASLGKTIFLSGVSEATFTLALWLPAVPLLNNWNNQVFDSTSGLKTTVQMTHGHFYPYFQFDTEEETRYYNVMSGGEVLRQTINNINGKSGGLPFWLTEFQVTLRADDNFTKPEYLMDFQSGLAVAQIYFTLIQEKITGAHFFNFSSPVGYGMIVDEDFLYRRPAGHVFYQFSELANQQLLSTTVTGAPTIERAITRGNIPANTVYSSLSVVSSKAPGNVYFVYILNSHHNQAATIDLKATGATLNLLQAGIYKSTSLDANNESNPATVSFVSASDVPGTLKGIQVPARSILILKLQ